MRRHRTRAASVCTTIIQFLFFDKDFFEKSFVIRMLQRGLSLVSRALTGADFGGMSTTGSLALAGSVTRGYVCWALRAPCLKTAASVFVLASP
jgi:hypothetical protein